MSDTFELRLERLDGYRFRADFGSSFIPSLIVDEAPPIGRGTGPNPAGLLAVAVGDCLSASLLFCLGKARLEVASLRTVVVGSYFRNERRRLRVRALDVAIEIDVPDSSAERLSGCLAAFEDYCVVTGSVREGIDVSVRVTDPEGRALFSNPPRE